MRIAGIGTRDLPPEEVEVCEKIGKFCAEAGIRVSSGNAYGADQAFGRGVNSVDPTLLDIALPWASYNQEALVDGNVVRSDWPELYFQIAAKHHPRWDKLSGGGRALHTRNVGILMPLMNDQVALVIALPNTTKPWGGGTGMGIKVASHEFHIPVENIRYWQPSNLHRLCEQIREMKEKEL